MNDKKSGRPPEGTPEFEAWIEERAAKRVKEVFGGDYKPAEFDESSGIAGSSEILDKTDAELFPDDTEDYMPSERKPKLVHNRDKDNG